MSAALPIELIQVTNGICAWPFEMVRVVLCLTYAIRPDKCDHMIAY